SRTPDFIRSLAPADSLIRPGESHFAHLWRIAVDGKSACPRWSPKSDALVFEGTHGGLRCAQIFSIPGRGLASDGKGLATSPAFLGRDNSVVYSCAGADSCRSMADRWRDSLWPLYADSDLLVRDDSIRAITRGVGAIECNTSPDGKTILYTAS